MKKTKVVNFICGPSGGKCLAINTLVMMVDTTVKPVQSIRVGDKIMGDDFTPRTVMSLAFGVDNMYYIAPRNPEYGTGYTVTQDHILCLKYNNHVVDMTVEDYLQLPIERQCQLSTFRAPNDKFSCLESPIDIYSVEKQIYYGFMLDGNHRFLLGDYTVTHNSVMSALVFAELKMMHKSVELVPEIAKWLIYNNATDKLDDQAFVSVQQYRQLKALDGKVDYIVGDSGLITGLYYNLHYKPTLKTNETIQQTEQFIHSLNNEFDNIYIVLERNPDIPFEQHGRVHTEEESKTIDTALREMVDTLGVKYTVFTSDRNSVPAIVEYILQS